MLISHLWLVALENALPTSPTTPQHNMGKQQKVQDALKGGKKRKHQGAAASDAPAQSSDKGGSFLFGGNGDAQLDDIFGKSVSFLRPTTRRTGH